MRCATSASRYALPEIREFDDPDWIVVRAGPYAWDADASRQLEVAPERRSRYRLHLPYTILLRLGWGGKKGMVSFFASQPVDEDRCIGYVAIGRNYDREQPDSVLQSFEDTILRDSRSGRARRRRRGRPRRRRA